MTSADDPGEPRRRGGLWDAVDDIEHVVGQTEPPTVPQAPPVPPAAAPPPPAPRATAPPPLVPPPFAPPVTAPPPPAAAPPRPPVSVRPSPLMPIRPVPPPSDDPSRPGPAGRPRRSALPYLVGGMSLVLLALAVVVLLVTDRSTGPVTLPLPSGLTAPGESGSFGGTPPPAPTLSGPGPEVTRPPATPGPSGSASPSTGPEPSGSAEPARLTARYATVDRGALGLGGYTGQVRISNPGGAAVSGWQVILTLPSGATVDGTSGAESRQDGRAVTFAPTDATRDVAAGASVEFTFTVNGLLAGQPTGCAIDGHPCA